MTGWYTSVNPSSFSDIFLLNRLELGRKYRFRTRALLALSGRMGLYLDPLSTPPKDLLWLHKVVNLSNQHGLAHVIARGDLYRLWNPFEVGELWSMFLGCSYIAIIDIVDKFSRMDVCQHR